VVLRHRDEVRRRRRDLLLLDVGSGEPGRLVAAWRRGRAPARVSLGFCKNTARELAYLLGFCYPIVRNKDTVSILSPIRV
jgi:hypothetical protein